MIDKNKKFTIIGSGAMGTAIAKVLHDTGFHNLMIYGIDEKELNDLKNGVNSKYFPNSTDLPKLKTTNDMNEAVHDANYVILAVPSVAMASILIDIVDSLNKKVLFINVSKGFYPDSEKSLHQGICEVVSSSPYSRGVVSLIGPSHAEEIVLKMPTVVAVVSKNKKYNEEVQSIFKNDYFKTYTQRDVKGAEVGAAYKNVLAIAAGLSAGMGFGVNSQAGLLTRGINEMSILNKALGGKAKTLMGLTGVGDLIVTATSDLSRNYTFGKQYAKQGKKALKSNKTVEGLYALKVIYKIMISKNLQLPIVKFLYDIIYNDKPRDNVIKKMWSSSSKEE